MESQQMMELLLKEIRDGQEQMVAKLSVDRKADKEEIRTHQAKLLAKRSGESAKKNCERE
jgi:hypothetical protein